MRTENTIDDGEGPGAAQARGGSHSPHGRAPARPGWVPVLATAAWFVLWYFTPGLHSRGVGALVDGEVASILVEMLAAVIIVVPILLAHRQVNRRMFARSRLVYLYAVPAVLALALPLYYSMPLPVGVYMIWMTVSVFWQDYLTFGLLQHYIGRRLPTWATVSVVAVVFYLGHAIFLPGAFAPQQILPALAILAMGVIFALLRARLGTLHLLLALHLSFYFIFA